jgi:hypothetical protein
VASEYSYGDYLVRVDSGVVEQFKRIVVGSYRLPISWASAEFEQRKHDVVRVTIGVAADPAASFFSGVAYTNRVFSVEIPASEALQLRTFLGDAARSAGRAL